jgi:hypothetical protein
MARRKEAVWASISTMPWIAIARENNELERADCLGQPERAPAYRPSLPRREFIVL